MSRNQKVSPHSHTLLPSASQGLTNPTILTSAFSRLLPLLVFFGEGREGDGAGTCRRHITHGIIKYRGSTRGAVISESAVERMKMRKKEVLGPSFCAGGLVASGFECGGTGVDGVERARYAR